MNKSCLWRPLALAFCLGGLAGLSQAASSAVPVLIYHEIVTDGRAPGETVISLDRFTEQMRYLADNGYHPISMKQLVDFMQGKAKVPNRPVVLTFDDGWKNVLNAVPVLQRHRFKASFWIIAGPKGIGGDYVDWADVQALANQPGFEVHSHTLSHPWNPLDNLVTWVDGKNPGKGQADARDEIAESRRLLGARTGKAVSYLAWPCGWYNEALVTMARQAGYTALLTAESGLSRPGDDVLRIRRTFIDGACDLQSFAHTLEDGKYRVCQTTKPTTQGHSPATASR